MDQLTIEANQGFQAITMNWSPDCPGFERMTFTAVGAALRAADRNPDIACSVFFGVPRRCFCLGTDARAFASDADLDDLSEIVQRFFRSLINTRKPLIAAVDGMAIGLGMTMLCHFDAIFATRESVFKAPFVDWGLTPEAGSSLLLPETVGYRRAFELFCLGGEMSATEAERFGFVTRVVDRERLYDTAVNAARHLAKSPERALTTTRELMRMRRPTLARRVASETEAFKMQVREEATQRRLKVMSRASRMALAG